MSDSDAPPITGAGIEDVARAARVSPSTVSRVLNRSFSTVAISEATAERVRVAAATLRYRPNAAARSLRTTKTQTVGVIMRDLLHPFSAEFSRAFYAVCRARGYHVLMGNASSSAEEGWTLGDILSPDRVDGILLLGDLFPSMPSHEGMATFVRDHHHVVAVGCRPSLAGEVAMSVDNGRGVTLGLEYLLAMGHRSIAYIGPTQPPMSWEEEQRWAAYGRFMEAHGLPWDPDQASVMGGNDLAAAQKALQRILSAPARVTAACVINDTSALLLLKAALSSGLRVPEDLSLIGFDGLQMAELSTPGLTTVCQPIESMGRYAATLLLDRIGAVVLQATPPDGAAGTNPVVFSPTLVCRESVCSLHA